MSASTGQLVADPAEEAGHSAVAQEGSNDIESGRPQKEHGKWTEEDEQVFPKNNIPLVFFALLLTMFLVSNNVAIRSVHLTDA